MLSLILATKSDVPKGFSRSTLIVVPLSVLSNWEKQIEDHVKPNALSYCVYYGTGRNMDAEALREYDVVITTYQTVVGEHSGAPSGKSEVPSKKKQRVQQSLFEVKWKVRIGLVSVLGPSELLSPNSESFWMKPIVFVTQRPRWLRPFVDWRPSVAGL